VTAPPYSGGDVAGELRRFAGLLAGWAGQGVVSWPDVRTAPAAAGLAADAARLRLPMETSSVSAIDGR
jgi:hypothetical protein